MLKLIKQWLERRKEKRVLRVFRREMLGIGISTYHLTDDELIELTLRWTERITKAFGPLMLTAAEAAQAMRELAGAMAKLDKRGVTYGQ